MGTCMAQADLTRVLLKDGEERETRAKPKTALSLQRVSKLGKSRAMVKG